MRGGWRGFPDLRFDETDRSHRTASGDQVAWRWRMRGMMTGPLDPPGFAPTGRAMEIEGVDLWTMRDGRIARYRALGEGGVVRHKYECGRSGVPSKAAPDVGASAFNYGNFRFPGCFGG